MRNLLLLALTAVCTTGDTFIPAFTIVGLTTNDLFLWYKADNMGVAYSNGATITNWNDSSPTGITLTTRDNATTNPVYTNSVAAINNQPVAAWAGPEGEVETLHPTIAYGAAGISGITVVFLDYITTNATFPALNNWSCRTADNAFSSRYTISGTDVVRLARGKNATSTATLTNTPGLDTWQVMSWQWDSSSGLTVIQDNTHSITGAVSTTGTSTLDYAQFQYGPTSMVAELLVYTNKLSSTRLRGVRSYIATKYGLTITP